ncbi:MAG: hypothetical protein A2Z47_05385 [Thermodesulfovibrio sp. RBG_19FT_COMBO_42_12]|nr:MAG: hypothetical protein A2Z47_05385 [Thermodesulfovibrio sp. RBG_19FT_COMBO_42_12]
MKLRLSLKLMNVFILSVFLFMGVLWNNASAQNEAQQRLMAKRAARVDALRNLTEIIYGLQIDSQTTVRDFVTQSDLIRSRVSAVIQGAEETDYKELPDGTAEVTMEITLGDVEDILDMDIQYDGRTVQATGYGAPSGEVLKPSQPAYSSNSIRAIGSGLEPNDPNMSQTEKALMAKRAAKLDALRNLAEQVYGVRITSDSYVRDFVLQSDDTRSRVNTFIQGARVVSEQQMPDGSYQVEVELDIEPLRDILGIR